MKEKGGMKFYHPYPEIILVEILLLKEYHLE